jgi:hypothetical protein
MPPKIESEKLYEVKLAGQSTVTFVAKPGKPTLNNGAHAGLVVEGRALSAPL